MKEVFRPYLFKITIFTLIILIVSIVLTRIVSSQVILPILPLIPLFFYVVNILGHYLILRITLKKIKLFFNYFMISTFVKLMLYMAVILIYALAIKEGTASFTLSFFGLYILYSVFEVVTLSSYTKKTARKNS